MGGGGPLFPPLFRRRICSTTATTTAALPAAMAASAVDQVDLRAKNRVSENGNDVPRGLEAQMPWLTCHASRAFVDQ
ncbi:hypothetical protein E2562_038973 [Oryza meyeriana var. granulata]|uniref:Uncharacterized protein n=1 Tax=Oryza meyeriana var. granulata TaxID=110450 RepID=A0A6G1BQF6_9ORYZ|nr:hypothetical protein E2562_038973 [Oryza meyeriana var. granulata]